MKRQLQLSRPSSVRHSQSSDGGGYDTTRDNRRAAITATLDDIDWEHGSNHNGFFEKHQSGCRSSWDFDQALVCGC